MKIAIYGTAKDPVALLQTSDGERQIVKDSKLRLFN